MVESNYKNDWNDLCIWEPKALVRYSAWMKMSVTEEDNLFYSTAHANIKEVTERKRCRKEL